MAHYTFPKDISEFVDVAAILEATFPVGVVVATADNTNPEVLGLPGTWEAM